MSPTLNLVDHLLALARKYQDLGQTQHALGVLTRLNGFRELPGPAAEEAQVRLAQIHLQRRRYARARRCLAAVLKHNPDRANYQFLMATACQAENRGDLQRAAGHYRQALELDDSQVKCLLEAGALSIRLGRTDEGLRRLRRAAELAPDDPQVIARLARGLRQCGQGDEARRVLRAALFRNPRAPRFRRLWHDHQFQQLRQEQERGRLDRQRLANRTDEPVLLPFVRPAGVKAQPPALPEGVRLDGPGTVAGPHQNWPSRRSDQRRVQ
jgi:tetratricopeptide (TPR) repeat protein